MVPVIQKLHATTMVSQTDSPRELLHTSADKVSVLIGELDVFGIRSREHRKGQSPLICAIVS